jgi:hypothetical protein
MTTAFLIKVPFLGEQRKVEAIGEILNEDYGVKLYLVDADMRRMPLIREILRFLILHTRFRRFMRYRPLARIVFRLAISGLKLPEGVKPDFVVATMSAYEVSAILLVTAFEAQWIHVGPTKRAWKDLVTLAVCPPAPRPPLSRFVNIEIEPTPVRLSAKSGASVGRQTAVLLVGDFPVRKDSRQGGTHFKTNWGSLLAIMEAISAKLGMGWIVSTAPRTSNDTKLYLQAKLAEFGDKIPILETVWWKPAAPQTRDIVRDADLILVTEDSRSMLSDAVATGAPVYLLGEGPCRQGGYNRCLIDSMIARRRAVRLDVSDCEGFVPDLGVFRPLEECWSAPFRREMASLFGPPRRQSADAEQADRSRRRATV